MEKVLVKHKVCAQCHGSSVVDIDCICMYSNNYPTIELEFEECACCGNVLNDGNPHDTPFNIEQWKKFEEDGI